MPEQGQTTKLCTGEKGTVYGYTTELVNSYYEAGTYQFQIGQIVPDKTETHVESIPANVFSRELLRPIDNTTS